MKKPDNVVFNNKTNEYDAFKKNYPTSFNSKNFNLEELKDIKNISKPYFLTKLNEIKNNYNKIVEKLNWNQRIFNSKYSFKPIIGKKYYLYTNKKNEDFLSLINPNEWQKKFIGTFVLDTNNVWEKID